ncbi:MAG: radical SAM protein [Sedimentisphaerales bacterium]
MINISKLYCGLAGQSDHLRYGDANSFGPVIVYNCTRRCNLKCLHCYSSSSFDENHNELTTAQAKQLLLQLAEVNCPVVLFSGGEPLLRSDLFELLEEARELGLQTVISTNGTLIEPATSDKLAEVGISYVGISIDGGEEFHDIFRQSKGSFKAALRGIKNCQVSGIKTGLRFTITKTTAEQIPAVFDIAVSVNVRRICFYHLISSGRAKEHDEQIPTPQQTRHVLDVIIEKTDDSVQKGLVDEVLTVGNHADGPYLLTKMAEEIQNHVLSTAEGSKPCPERSRRTSTQNYDNARQLLLAAGGNKIGEKIGCVSWDGNVHPDQFWHNYSLGNVKEKTFKEIWDNPTEPVLNKLRKKNEFADARCLKCKWFDLCKGNFRFLGANGNDENWLNEPDCYLTDEEIA